MCPPTETSERRPSSPLDTIRLCLREGPAHRSSRSRPRSIERHDETSFCYTYDFWGVLGFFVGIPILSIVGLVAIAAVIRGQPRRSLAIVSAMVAFCAVVGVLERYEFKTRTEVRWLWNSEAYKAQVLAQPAPVNGELRHIEWDGWGFPGAGDTVVYLVFAPNDSLTEPTRNHAPGRFSGIPCKVPGVHRLEKDWYTVLFYTDWDWNHCG
jgi:hypothetical protein